MKLKVFVNTRTPERGLDILEKKCEVKLVPYLHHKIKEKGGESSYNFKNDRYYYIFLKEFLKRGVICYEIFFKSND